MEVLTLELPAMYGDHHVLEVRRLLFELPGVEDVYASSAFQVVEITYDPAKVDEEAIKDKLDGAGYLGDLPIPVEVPGGVSVTGEGRTGFYRHTAADETTGQVVGFTQQVNYKGRALWPCPGMAPLTGDEE